MVKFLKALLQVFRLFFSKSDTAAKKVTSSRYSKEQKLSPFFDIEDEYLHTNNNYTIQSNFPEASKIFWTFLTYQGKKNVHEIVCCLIKYNITVKEIWEYLDHNRKRYFDKIKILYDSNKTFKDLKFKQKEVILESFRATPLNITNPKCHVDFLRASDKNEMILAFEFDCALTDKYYWIVNHLNSDGSIFKKWNDLLYILNGEFIFVANYFNINGIINEFNKRKYITILKNPSLELLLEKMPFEIIKYRFKNHGITIKSRDDAKKLAGSIQKDLLFFDQDLEKLNGYFVKLESSFEELKKEFSQVLEFNTLIANVL